MTTPAIHWGRIPLEMRQRPQWVIAGADKAPMVCGPNGLYRASVTDPSQWHDFNTAAQAAHSAGLGIGYVLHESDPYTCIDLDVKDASNEPDPNKWTKPQEFDRFWKIVQWFDSYTETSRSGKGLHVWVRGDIGAGMRRDGVEVYSRERYIICTGQTVLDRPIHERNELLEILSREMRGFAQADLVELEELEAEEEDWSVLDTAVRAANAYKFVNLWTGNWKKSLPIPDPVFPEGAVHEHGVTFTAEFNQRVNQITRAFPNPAPHIATVGPSQEFSFPSQSEADLALMSMFTFYSKSNEQCRRLFRMSALGQRDKAVKDNRYLNFTLRVIRSRQAREAENAAKTDSIANAVVAQLRSEEVQRINSQHLDSIASPLHVPGAAEPRMLPAPAAAAVTLAGPAGTPVAVAGDKGIAWPPGMAGAIAGFIYQSAPRPVKEVAIVATMGLLAGICGKAFAIPQSGLNLYMILVARSAVGKEALHSGISALCKAANSRCPSIMNFVDFSDFASGPALVKAIVGQQSMVNVAGEWGRKLKRMAHDDGRDGALSTLRTVMTNLYQKSGPQAIVGGITYSNKDSNIASVSGVSYSMIGETTPGTFYESLTENMMEDGFLSRFTIVEYDGDRPPLNSNPITEPSKSLGDALGDLAQYAQQLVGLNQFVNVQRTNEAAAIMGAFELECDTEINSTTDETWRQMWNRASLKVMRISALLAVADNWLHPVVTKDHVDWALDLIRRDIDIMKRRLESGDVGIGDHSRERKLLSIMREYVVQPLSDGYKIPKGMQENGIIPRKYLQTRAGRVTAFTQHRMGSSAALDLTLRSLVDSGYVMEVDKAKMVEAYSFHGKCFRILNLPDYSAERGATKK